jgi:hypothetical protein
MACGGADILLPFALWQQVHGDLTGIRAMTRPDRCWDVRTVKRAPARPGLARLQS